jgi:hypothetical protein
LKKNLGIKKGDWKAIAFCVFAAVTLWFFNAMTSDYDVDVTHPLIIRYEQKQYTPLTKLPTEIRFNTSASGWDIFTKTNFINSSPIELDMDDFKKKRYMTSARLKTIVAKQMNGIRINEVLDDTIYVNFDKVKSKKVKLQVDPTKLSLTEGYYLSGSVILDPMEAIVTGPASLMKNIPDVINVPITTKDISGNYEETVPLNVITDNHFTCNIDKVKVKLETFQLEKVEKELRLTKVNFPKNKKITLSDKNVQLTYYAKKEDLPLIETQKFEVLIDFYSLDIKNKTIKVKLKKIPELIHGYQFKPAIIKVTYDE